MRERFEAEDAAQFQHVKTRLLLCVPFNASLMYLTFKYAKSMGKMIGSKRNSGGRKASNMGMFGSLMMNLTGIMSLYLIGNLAILGVNPVRVYREQRKREEEAIMA